MFDKYRKTSLLLRTAARCVCSVPAQALPAVPRASAPALPLGAHGLLSSRAAGVGHGVCVTPRGGLEFKRSVYGVLVNM